MDDNNDIFENGSFTDFRTHSSPDEMPKQSSQKEKFVVHIDDSISDSMDYDFSAFSTPEARLEEEKRKQMSYSTFSKLESEFTNENREIFEEKPKLPTQRPRVQVSDRRIRRQETQTNSTVPESAKYEKPTQAPAPTSPEYSNWEKAREQANLKNIPQVSAESEQSPQAEVPEQKTVVRMRTRSFSGVLSGFGLFLALVFLFTTSFSALGFSGLGDILAYKRDEASVSVVIESSVKDSSPSLEDVLDCLHDAGLIKQKWICRLFAKFRNYDGYSDSKGNFYPVEFVSGIYYLEPTLGLEGMLNAVKLSTASSADTITLTFPEGWSINQIFDRLEKNGVCDASKLQANLVSVAKQYDFYFDIEMTDVRYLGVEGYLFPDTYEFYKNENAVSVLKKLFNNSDDKWTKENEEKAKALGYTRDEVLTVASIIQREAANQSQMADIASVLYNRLDSSTFPSLQCNSTSDYITKYVKPYVSDSYAQIYADAYNTYKIEGLPPGPICNPGMDAIEAALNPNDTTYCFFVHNNNGKIYLSSTYDQFQYDCVQVAKDNAS